MSLLQSKFSGPLFAQAGSSFRDAFLVFGILVVLVGAIFMLTLLIKDRAPKETSPRRKRSSRQSGKRGPGPSGTSDDTEAGAEENDEEGRVRVKEVTVSEDGSRRRRKFRKRRKDHRPRNPTLAETGGLPAERKEEIPDRPES